jgi:hypothetical protein
VANEKMVEEWELENRVVSERSAAAYHAVPEQSHKHFELTEATYLTILAEKALLNDKLAELQAALDDARSPRTKLMAQALGFVVGVVSSLVASSLFLSR